MHENVYYTGLRLHIVFGMVVGSELSRDCAVSTPRIGAYRRHVLYSGITTSNRVEGRACAFALALSIAQRGDCLTPLSGSGLDNLSGITEISASIKKRLFVHRHDSLAALVTTPHATHYKTVTRPRNRQCKCTRTSRPSTRFDVVIPE